MTTEDVFFIVDGITTFMEQFLITKLYIPPFRSEHISRHGLLNKLNNGLHRKLTLISAPAGFGKTMLVSEWVNSLKSKSTDSEIVWISLDEQENDPARFLAYLVVALQRIEEIDAQFGEGLLGMLQSPQPLPSREILTSLINKIAVLSKKIIIVLDDFHVIESQQVHETTAFLLENLPPQIHLVIATRDDPPLPLARIRARGQMTELRAADLRFSSAEISQYLNQAQGLNLSQEDISTLETRSEGWIAGLQLAAISIQGQKDSANGVESFSGRHRFVLDYLIEEVLEQQPESIQRFLLQTAVLNRFTGPLCDALTGQENGQETLEDLERANLFIVPLDDKRQWYRYHHLFADLLRMRLNQAQSEQFTILYSKASEWFEQNDYPDEAIKYSLRTENHERSTHLLDKYIEQIINRGEYTNAMLWLEKIPEELLHTKPDLCILNAWYLFSRGHLDAAENNLLAAEKHLPTETSSQNISKNTESIAFSELRGRVAAVRAFISTFRVDVPAIIQNAHQALDALPKQDLVWRSAVSIALGDAYGITGNMDAAYKARLEALEVVKTTGNIYLTLLSAMKLAVTIRMQGRLQRVVEICEEYNHLVDGMGLSQMEVVGWLYAVWAEALVETGELDEALIKGKHGVKLTADSEDIAMRGWSHLCLAKILFTRGDFSGAEETIRNMEESMIGQHMPPYISGGLLAWRARILLTLNKLDAVTQWCETRGLEVGGTINQLNASEYLVFARFLLAREVWGDAFEVLQQLIAVANAGKWTSIKIEIFVLQALIYQAKGDLEKALTSLNQALTLAEPGGFVSVFVNEGPPLARMLYEAAKQNTSPIYINRLLSAFPISETEEDVSQQSKDATEQMIEPLSTREIVVLQLLAQGLRRQEIATKLVLSPHTIKSHVRNIYGKLGVNNQMQAVAKARGLGLIDLD